MGGPGWPTAVFCQVTSPGVRHRGHFLRLEESSSPRILPRPCATRHVAVNSKFIAFFIELHVFLSSNEMADCEEMRREVRLERALQGEVRRRR